MARPSKQKSLRVWMNGVMVGRWTIAAQGNHEFRYEESWLASSESRPISLSLPLAPHSYAYTGTAVLSFFDNLLPDSTEIRLRIRSRYGAASMSPFDLLAEVGRDCVGAIQLLPEDKEPKHVRKIEARPVDEHGVERILNGVTAAGPSDREQDDAFRISIAGAQEKTALLRHKGRWMLPRGSTPSTHILKLPLGRIGRMDLDMGTSVENEWLCSKIATALGIRTASCDIAKFGATTVLVVERFDRRLAPDGSWYMRLPQEDFCQVTGTPPDGKYEVDGGPGIESIMRLLLGTQEPAGDREAFFIAQILFWLLAAPDGHAKNFSVSIERGGRFRLAPLYDIMSAYPVMGHGSGLLPPEKLRMAMAFVAKNRHYEWSKIGMRHIREMARRCGIDSALDDILSKLIHGVPQAISKVSSDLPKGFPESVSGPIFEGLDLRVKLLHHG